MYHKVFNKHLPVKRIGGIFSLLFSCFLIVGCSQVESEEDKSEAAIRAVLKQEFTGPDKEYIRLYEDIEKQLLQKLGDSPSESIGAFPKGAPEMAEIDAYVKKARGSYFTDNGFENFRPFAFSYHWLRDDYQMKVTDIEVVQSENTPTNYHFTVQVDFENTVGEITQYEMSGKAICPDEGKIGKIIISDKDGLMAKLQEGAIQ